MCRSRVFLRFLTAFTLGSFTHKHIPFRRSVDILAAEVDSAKNADSTATTGNMVCSLKNLWL